MRRTADMTRCLGLVLVAACAHAPASPATPAGEPPAHAWRDAARAKAVSEGTVASTGFLLEATALVDEAGGRVYVTGTDGHIEGLALADGAQVFRSEARGMPLAVLPAGAVAIVDDARRIALLDRDAGTVLFASAPTRIGGSITQLDYRDGKLTIGWGSIERADLACCGGGVPRTTQGTTILAVATGRLGGEVRSWEGISPLAPAKQPPLARTHATIETGTPSSSWTGTVTPRTLHISLDGASWTHAVVPYEEGPPAPADPRP